MKTYKMKINSENYEAKILEYDGITARVEVNGVDFFVELNQEEDSKSPKLYRSKRELPSSETMTSKIDLGINAPIPGVIMKILVKSGEKVKKGDILLTLEAMKMESEINAPFSGEVGEIFIKENNTVDEGQELLELIPSPNQKVTLNRRKTDLAQTKPVPEKHSVGSKIMRSPLPGKVLRIIANEGDEVTADQDVIIIEAMKMESEITSDYSGTIKKMFVNKGDSVQEGQNLFEVE